MKTHILLSITILCFTVILIISGCYQSYGSGSGPYQFSPDAELTTIADRRTIDGLSYGGFGYTSRVVSLEPPGWPADEVATLSTVEWEGTLISSIKSGDGKVIFEGRRNMVKVPFGISLVRRECQLPAGTYTIGVDYCMRDIVGYTGLGNYSTKSQYITIDLQKGRHYVITWDGKKDNNFWTNDPGQVKIVEKPDIPSANNAQD